MELIVTLNTLLFDSRNPLCKSPFGALPTDDVVTFRLFLPIAYQLSAPVLLMYQADRWDTPERIEMRIEESDGICCTYKCIFYSPDPQLYFYLFEVQGPNGTMRISRDPDGFGQLSGAGNDMWQLTVYDREMRTPDFLKEGVMYQIFPDRFCNSGSVKENVPGDRWTHGDWYELPNYMPDRDGEYRNNDYFGGDLRGITEKLPYLHELGIRVLYLNPIFEAHSNHRYNTADYMKIDPMLGNEEDLKTLCAEAKKLGIRLILDGVFNHAGSDSVYFNKERRYGDGGAFNDPSSQYRSWFDFDQYPNRYQCWWGFTSLPNFNESDPGYSNFICGEGGVLRKWIRDGISGWRLDVADELPDAFLDKICQSVKEFDPQAAIIGEVWEDATTKFAYGVRRRYFLGGQLDSVMNYPFKDAILSYIRYGTATQFYNTLMSIMEHYPKPALDVLMNSLSTHDVERAITALAGEPAEGRGRDWQGQNNLLSPALYEHGKKLFRLASLLQYTLPGIPCLYYGDEAGLFGYRDPFNRSCYPWGREDADMLELFRALGELRTNYPQLSTGAFSAVRFTPEVASYVRDCGEAALFVAVNRTDKDVLLYVPEEFADARVIFGNYVGQMLPPYECVVLAAEETA